MKKIISLCCLCSAIIVCSYAQSDVGVTPSLFKGDETISKFLYSFEIDAEGESTIDKVKFENEISIEKTNEAEGRTTYLILADPTTTSNAEVLKDGEVAMVHAMIGINATLVIGEKGELIEVLNEEEIWEEYKNGLTSMSEQRRESMVQSMKQSNAEVFFQSLYAVNYASLFSNLNEVLEAKGEDVSDSLILASDRNPKTAIRTIKEVKVVDDIFYVVMNIQTNSELFVDNSRTGFKTEILPVHIDQYFELMINKEGTINNIKVNNTTRREGMKMFMDGKERSAMGEMIEYRNVEYKRL